MSGNLDKPLRPMHPVRHLPTFFSIDISSISLKDVQQQMEYPFFSLSKKPDLEIRRYEDRNGNSLEITPSVKGLPTIYDKDFLIYAISQVMHCLNNGEAASRRIILYAADMLEFANRTKGGKDYRAIEDSLLRLSGCRIKTNICTGDIYQTSIFGLIERGDLIRKYGFNGRLQHVEVTLSEWLWNAIEARQVLTLHPDYFRLRQPLERRIYEIARKQCGQQMEWRVSLELLHLRTGSRSPLRQFRRSLRKLVTHDDLLDYAVSFDAERDMVTFRRQEGSLVGQIPSVSGSDEPELPPAVMEEARRKHGTDIDLAAAERDWRRWMDRKMLRPTNPPALFLSFLATWADRRHSPQERDDDAPDWIAEMALEWWATLEDGEREHWKGRVGEYIELGNGEGWYRSETSIAREAFDQRWRHQRCPPARTELPPALLARAAVVSGMAPDRIEEGWRRWIPGQRLLHDRLLYSVMSYAKDCAAGRENPG